MSFFETTIRVLGGLVSAYDLTGDRMFLEKAQDLADRLMPAFKTKSGLPLAMVHLSTGDARRSPWGPGVILAEVGTVQLEFITLAKHLHEPKYARAAVGVYDVIAKNKLEKGMYPLCICSAFHLLPLSLFLTVAFFFLFFFFGGIIIVFFLKIEFSFSPCSSLCFLLFLLHLLVIA